VIAAKERLGGGRIVFIGDSSYDVTAARAANVPVVVAAYGYCDKPPAELGGDATIESLAGLVSALETL
jgi:phosphoglycolate phosphatase